MKIESEKDYRFLCYLGALYYEYHCESFDLTLPGRQGRGGTWIPYNLGKASRNAIRTSKDTCELFGLEWKFIKPHLEELQRLTFFELQSLWLEHRDKIPKRQRAELKGDIKWSI